MSVGLEYSQIVAQITQLCPQFQYVAYIVTPHALESLASNPTLPAAFVSPQGKSTEDNKVRNSGDLQQWLTEKFSVVVQFSNAGDLMAQSASTLVQTYRDALRKALVNYHPLPFARTVQPIIEESDELWNFLNGAMTYWIFNYSIRYQINTGDCYTPTPTFPTIITTTITPTLG